MTSLPPTPNTRKWCISWGWLLSAVKLFPFGHHHNIYLCTAARFWILTQWCKYSLIWVTVPGDGFLFYFFLFFYINWSVSGHFHTCPILGSPPLKTPSVLCKATEGLWQTRNGKSVLVQSCGETWHLSPFSAFTRELWKWTQFPVPPVWRCCVCVSVLLAWLARCSVLTVGSVVAGVSAFSRASAKKLSASFPSRLCGLSGSWFACDCLRYFLNAYSTCVWF